MTRLRSLAAAALLSFAASAVWAAELIMVEEPGCAWCARWMAEIGPIYPKTDEGRFAPLRRIDISEQPPEGVSLARKAVFTPTFILVENGQELARIEGYPGEDFFWALLKQILTTHTDFKGGSS